MRPATELSITLQDVRRAARAGDDVVRETPVLSTRTLSERTGGAVVLKAENLQRTGSCKLRGALAKIASLGESSARGVVTGGAGNHGHAVAYAARERHVPCEVFMPAGSSIAKAKAATALGASVRLGGEGVEDALSAARERAAQTGATFVHPFDDPVVIAGQGAIGLELLAQIPDLAQVVVPIGGGGLISGIGAAIKAQRPEVEIVGVQVETCAPFPVSLVAGVPFTVPPARTIADGIAVTRPGELTLALIAKCVDELVVVGEESIAEAMVFLLECANLVVEGAGAVGVAALLAGSVGASPVGSTAVVLSGGNVGAGRLAEVARRHETRTGRRLVLPARVPDRPGALATLLAIVAEQGANLLDLQHVREGLDLGESAVQLVIETRGVQHADEVTRAVRDAGYPPLNS